MVDNGKICLWYLNSHLVEPWWDEDTKVIEYPFTLDGLLASLQKRSCNMQDARYYVYFITDGQYVKIGRTNNVKQRLSCLQTSSAVQLRIISIIPCMEYWISKDIERDLHCYFGEYHTSGEWFNILDNADYLSIVDQYGCLNEVDILCTLHITLAPGDRLHNILNRIQSYLQRRGVSVQFNGG